MFERFNHEARSIVVLAQDRAREWRHDQIDTEHILLALLRGEGVAAQVLDRLAVSEEAVAEQVAGLVGRGDKAVGGQIPFSPAAKKTLELALREALVLGHNSIGSEHILLGVVREHDGVGARVLANVGADYDAIWAAVRVANGEASSSTEWRWRRLARSIDKLEADPQPDAKTLRMTAQELIDGLLAAEDAAIRAQDVAQAAGLVSAHARLAEIVSHIETVLNRARDA